MDAHEIIRRCHILAGCTEEPGRITRTFLSAAMREAHRLVRAWMEQAGLAVTLDAAGNLRGVAGPPDAPRLMMGSHLDTVPNAGAFDGILGVVLAIAVAASRPPDRAVEVVAFSEEEGVRFGIPFIGSRALAGDPVMDPAVLEAIRDFGLDPAKLPDAVLAPEVRGYLEFHIEQGPVLETLNFPLGVVGHIAGQSRYLLTFTGAANHAGTTPMHLRRDALAAAAEWIGAVEQHARNVESLVATVGQIEASPGASNVIPGEVRVSLDVRHANNATRHEAANHLLTQAQTIAGRRKLTLATQQRLDQSAVPMLLPGLDRAVRAAGYPLHRMASGAGHDAMIIARKVPAAMLFLRTPGGISHHPAEAVLPGDISAALNAGVQFLLAR